MFYFVWEESPFNNGSRISSTSNRSLTHLAFYFGYVYSNQLHKQLSIGV